MIVKQTWEIEFNLPDGSNEDYIYDVMRDYLYPIEHDKHKVKVLEYDE